MRELVKFNKIQLKNKQIMSNYKWKHLKFNKEKNHHHKINPK